MAKHKVFISSNTNGECINLEIVVDVPKDILSGEVDCWSKRKALTLFYEKYWSNIDSSRIAYKRDIEIVRNALNMLDDGIKSDIMTKFNYEYVKYIKSYYGCEYPDLDFNTLSLKEMIEYLDKAGTYLEVYVLPKKRIKEILK